MHLPRLGPIARSSVQTLAVTACAWACSWRCCCWWLANDRPAQPGRYNQPGRCAWTCGAALLRDNRPAQPGSQGWADAGGSTTHTPRHSRHRCRTCSHANRGPPCLGRCTRAAANLEETHKVSPAYTFRTIRSAKLNRIGTKGSMPNRGRNDHGHFHGRLLNLRMRFPAASASNPSVSDAMPRRV